MTALDDLLARISDPALRADLEAEIAPLRRERELGLVFERHLPEKVRLHGLAVRRGAAVELRADQQSPTWNVTKIVEGEAHLRRRDGSGETITDVQPIEDLVVVREFGQPIYPGLKSEGRIERGGDKPFHTVINSENYHALETLLYTSQGQVDCVYIDPPYNTGARDWKYNNDYVDSNDGYRHSKWLSFMEKRLLLAKRLLNPESSVLIVTIDEKEYLRLGLLLEQVLPQARIQMVTIVIQGAGSVRAGELARSEEYAFFCFLGSAKPNSWTDDMLNDKPSTAREDVRWESLLRSGTHSERWERPNLYFPIFVDEQSGRIVGVGDSKPVSASNDSWESPEGSMAIFPRKSDGREGNWRVSPAALRELWSEGFVRAGKCDFVKGTGTFWYLGSLARKNISEGHFLVTGRDDQGALTVTVADAAEKKFPPRTVWTRARHNAGWYGTNLLQALTAGRRFPFPKSLYAVEDCLRVATGHKQDALIVDFFAGSGTTAHAVMRLNHQDGGSRRSISVTNNEIGPDAERELSKRGIGPGADEWEDLGIFRYITKPRLEAAVTGTTPVGEPVKGEYKFTDEFPMSDGFKENVEFFTLTYEDPDRVRLGAAFTALAPLLWLMAGAVGPRVDEIDGGWSVPIGGRYGVLFDADEWRGFADAVNGAEGLTHAFIVTDSDAVFQRVVAELSNTVTPVRLYESYLRSFAINTGVSE